MKNLLSVEQWLPKTHDHYAWLAAKIYLILFLTDLVLAATYFATSQLFHVRRNLRQLFDFDGEANIPAWFSSSQFLLIGIIFLALAFGWRYHRHVSRKILAVVGFAAVFLSMDESAQVHEYVTLYLKNVEWLPKFKGDHGVWIAVYPVVGLAVAGPFFRDARIICQNYCKATVIGAIGIGIFLFGAVGLEIVSYQFLRGDDALSALYKLEVLAEEFLELVGVSTIVYASLVFAQDYVEANPPPSVEDGRIEY